VKYREANISEANIAKGKYREVKRSKYREAKRNKYQNINNKNIQL